jgi:hypothetical protein
MLFISKVVLILAKHSMMIAMTGDTLDLHYVIKDC